MTTSIDADEPKLPATPPPNAQRVGDIVDIDLASGAAFKRGVAHDAFDALRRAGGIAWHTERPIVGTMDDNPLLQFVDSPGFWVVTSHALVTEVDRDQERFSSALGGTFMPSLSEESLAIFRQMMLNMDHPAHSRLRRVLADLFGMPRADRHLIFDWSNALLGADNPGVAQHAADSMDALAGMMAYGQAMADERRANPRDDIVGGIVTAEVDGDRLSDTEFQMFWLLLVVAGNETTRNAVSGSVVALPGASVSAHRDARHAARRPDRR